ncbi:MAG: ubiquinone/menaquinone biosynthesis methyltransferase [Fidelibacterota bacterium]|nr:MAG: ubiquinone/menaquinone biosynthesis methyltransferase [Candidatus Neomarinimicrobiota bacterium]
MEDKRQYTRTMFNEIAFRYDLLNRLLSLGMDLRWRNRLIIPLQVQPGERVLDVACGSGDVARLIHRRQPTCLITGADPAPAMLSIARRKFPALNTTCCESESLPFRSDSFQVATVAFGVRNFSRLETGLAEIYRILTPGGRLGILEFALPDEGRFKRIYSWYLTKAIHRLGALFSQDYAYRYLPESIQHFPTPDEFMGLLQAVGLIQINTEKYLGGVVRIYRGWKKQGHGEDILSKA